MKTLIIDIETAPIMGRVWQLWDNNLSLKQIADEWFIMSYSAKWLGEDEIFYADCRKDIGNDTPLLTDLHVLLDEADFIIAHNGDRFDLPKINARFILDGFTPPSPYRTIDTLKIAKRHFKFTSNKLEYLTGKLCKQQKLSHSKFAGFTLWNECMAGNDEAWDEMKAYNEMDVISLEELYIVLRPWSKQHPNMVTAEADGVVISCPKCGGTHMNRRGFLYTNKGKHQRYQCGSCNGWSSATTSVNTTDEKRSLLASR